MEYLAALCPTGAELKALKVHLDDMRDEQARIAIRGGRVEFSPNTLKAADDSRCRLFYPLCIETTRSTTSVRQPQRSNVSLELAPGFPPRAGASRSHDAATDCGLFPLPLQPCLVEHP